MENNTEVFYTIKDIELAILMSPKHMVDYKTPPYIDGDLDQKIETIEIKFFLFNLENLQKFKIKKEP